MRRRVVSVILVIALMGLILPGCVPKTDLIDCQSLVSEQADQIIELTSQVADLNATIETRDAEITEQLAEITALNATITELIKTAKLEVIVTPNPVVRDGDCNWRWRITVVETNGVGVKIDFLKVAYVFSYGIGLPKTHHPGKAFKWKGFDYPCYLPAYAGVSGGWGINYQSAVIGALFIVAGVDDNGNEVEGSIQVDFLIGELCIGY